MSTLLNKSKQTNHQNTLFTEATKTNLNTKYSNHFCGGRPLTFPFWDLNPFS